jgi:hypothetical protein
LKTLQSCTPRQSVLDGTADFVVNLADLAGLNQVEAREFLDSNVLTSGMELLLHQAFSRMSGEKSASGIYKLSESMGGGKTQTMIVAGILARYPKLADLVGFHEGLAKPSLMSLFHLPVVPSIRKSGSASANNSGSNLPQIVLHQKQSGETYSKIVPP